MNNLDMPPFPTPGTSGPQICEAVRFYLALVDELPFEQVRILAEHVKGCEGCAAEFQRLQQTTRLLATLPASVPSARVDNAILAFLHGQPPVKLASVQLHPEKQIAREPQTAHPKRRTSARRRVGTLALAAALLLLLTLVVVTFLPRLLWPSSGSMSAFELPSNLTWSGYVLHYTETKNNMQGKQYQIEVYQDLGTNQMHIESTMQGKFDIVVVTDQQNMLGEDMMHHIAQEGGGVANWTVDGSMFELEQLRHDLATHRALYFGQSTFMGQQVYQIRMDNGQILLLNMQYLPVNALVNSSQANSNTSLYTTCELVRTAQVSDSMWDMQVPSNFRMGQLPTKV